MKHFSNIDLPGFEPRYYQPVIDQLSHEETPSPTYITEIWFVGAGDHMKSFIRM